MHPTRTHPATRVKRYSLTRLMLLYFVYNNNGCDESYDTIAELRPRSDLVDSTVSVGIGVQSPRNS